MAKFRILHITNNLDEYPQCQRDNDEFPHIIGLVEDEYDMFVIDEDEGHIYPAGEFFYMVDDDIKSFSTETQQLEDELIVATSYIGAIAGEIENPVWEVPEVSGFRIKLSPWDRTFVALKKTKTTHGKH